MANILIIADRHYSDIVSKLSNWLEANDHVALQAVSYGQAKRKAATHSPFLILVDGDLSQENSLEICKQLRGDQVTADIPAILLTEGDPAQGRAQALLAGAVDYIIRPITAEKLSARLSLLLTSDEEIADQSQRLLEEISHTALSVIPCNLSWILSVDTREQGLSSVVAAASKGDASAEQFLQHISRKAPDGTYPLSQDESILVRVALHGAGEFNVPLSKLRTPVDRPIYEACAALDLYFVSVLPLQLTGAPVGVMLLGMRTPHDVQTEQGQQIVTAITRQAATAIQNTGLLTRLAEEKALHQSEHHFRQTLLDTMADGLLTYYPGGEIGFINERLARLAGYSAERIPGMSIYDLFSSEDRPYLDQWVMRSDLPRTSSKELALKRADGSLVPVRVVQAGTAVLQNDSNESRVIVITDLSQHKQREKDLTRQTHRLDVLTRAAQEISSTGSLDEAIQIILSEVHSVLEAGAAFAILRTTDGERGVIQSAVGPTATSLELLEFELKQSLAGIAMQEQRSLLVKDIRKHSLKQSVIDDVLDTKMLAAAVVPLKVEGHIIGAVQLLSQAPNAFDLNDIKTLEGLVYSASIAIENARLYSETQRHVRELMLMLETSEAASSTLSIEHVLETVAYQLIETLSVEWCMISSWDPHSETFVNLAEVFNTYWRTAQRKKIPAKQGSRVHDTLYQNIPGKFAVKECQLETPARLPGVETVLLLPIRRQDEEVVGLVEIDHASSKAAFSDPMLDRFQEIVDEWSQSYGNDDIWTALQPLTHLCGKLLRATRGVRCAIYKHEIDSIELLHEGGKIVWPLSEGPRHSLADNDLYHAMLTGQMPIAASLTTKDDLPGEHVTLPAFESGTLLLSPLIARGNAIGFVELITLNKERIFSESDQSLARGIGNVVGNALENARLYSVLLQRASQLETAYHDLQEADKLKAEWIQNVSHELRTPLTTLMGYIDLLLDGDLGPTTQKQRAGFNIMANKTRQLARMVEDILTIQQTEHEPLDRTLIGLDDIAVAAIHSMQPLAERASITIETDIAPQLSEMFIDSKLILQVFENLLNNAIKFSSAGSTILVSIEDKGFELETCVADEGIGFAEEEHDKVWRRFYQVDGSMTRQYGGTGLGLAIVKQIIEKHDGRVWVESTPGKGSNFYFSLPKMVPTDFPELFPREEYDTL